MIVHVRVEEAGVELVDRRSVGWRDVSPADVFAHDRGVFGLHQAVVAGVARTAFGLLDEQLFEQSGDGFVDKLASVVAVKVADDKGELVDRLLTSCDELTVGRWQFLTG